MPEYFGEIRKQKKYGFQTDLNTLFSKSHFNHIGIILMNVSQVTHGCFTAIDTRLPDNNNIFYRSYEWIVPIIPSDSAFLKWNILLTESYEWLLLFFEWNLIPSSWDQDWVERVLIYHKSAQELPAPFQLCNNPKIQESDT